MQLPVQITARDFPISAAILSQIRKRADKLNQFYNRINSCRIVLEMLQKHKRQGKLFNIRINVTVPGKEFVATHKNDQDLYIAVREAFSAITRQLEEHCRKRHGRVKTHSDILHGHVVRLNTREGYGFINGTDGNEYYFSITNASYPQFSQLLIGDAVEFIPEAYSDGWQAHHVVREKPHPIAA